MRHKIQEELLKEAREYAAWLRDMNKYPASVEEVRDVVESHIRVTRATLKKLERVE